jgi:hypothetical protein
MEYMTIFIRFLAENNNVWNLVSNEARVILVYERISCYQNVKED